VGNTAEPLTELSAIVVEGLPLSLDIGAAVGQPKKVEMRDGKGAIPVSTEETL
jgi:hypothetical protein